MQRFFDILFSGFALILLSPLLITIILVLRCTGEGEVFYAQQRVGRHGRMFPVLKFATMVKNSPSIGTGTVTTKNDPRVLPIGRILRKTKLNELPQLFNILNGTMSIIGPRPQTPRCFDSYPASSQASIKQVRPGLSGIGSIVFRNEEELMHADADPLRFYDEVVMPFKGRLEEWYEQRQGLPIYFLLIGLTVWVVLTDKLDLIWAALPSLPRPDTDLARLLGISDSLAAS